MTDDEWRVETNTLPWIRDIRLQGPSTLFFPLFMSQHQSLLRGGGGRNTRWKGKGSEGRVLFIQHVQVDGLTEDVVKEAIDSIIKEYKL